MNHKKILDLVNHKKILSINIYGLFAGDRILEINGKRLVDVTHQQAVEIIKDAPKTCMLIIQRGVSLSFKSSRKSSRSSPGSVGQPSPMTLTKDGSDTHLSLVNTATSDVQSSTVSANDEASSGSGTVGVPTDQPYPFVDDGEDSVT